MPVGLVERRLAVTPPRLRIETVAAVALHTSHPDQRFARLRPELQQLVNNRLVPLFRRELERVESALGLGLDVRSATHQRLHAGKMAAGGSDHQGREAL